MANLPLKILTVVVTTLLASVSGNTALAQDVADNPATEPAVITVMLDGPSDQQILDRITNIYLQLEQFQAIEVSAVAGVVTLAGNVSNETQAERALNLARRVEGVVTVEDNIERALDLQSNVAPLVSQFRTDFKQWVGNHPQK